MSRIAATYYDGRSSGRKAVDIQIYGDKSLRIFGLEEALTVSLADLHIHKRLGNTPRSIDLPDGARLDVADNDALDAELALHTSSAAHWLHRLESTWHYVLLSLAALVSITWSFIVYGIPAISKKVAYALPASVDEAIGEDGLAILDSFMFLDTDLETDRQQVVRSLFEDVSSDANADHELRLEFRQGAGLGANAFALPSGIVVITDELVLLAEHDEELVGILAHEVGHVVNRHALRMLLQNSATAAIMVTVTGDISALTALSATIPTALIQASYSRKFETEADDYAYDYLARHGIPERHLGAILTRLELVAGEQPEVLSYFSTHPRTEDRLRPSDD